MEENSTTNHQLVFRGKGTAYFEIQLANWVLTFITLGFYYPWAKATNRAPSETIYPAATPGSEEKAATAAVTG